jgi:NAD(P)-dependent dehydrogenase (short-subunit alcohol dehydrogenase family)
MSGRLHNKVAIVTGAGQRVGEGVGNGRATAIQFAREGAKLVLANRSLESLEETQRQIEREGFSAICVKADISIEDDCTTLMQRAEQEFGRIDILHNSVGVGGIEGDTTNVDVATWDSMMEINLRGAVLLSKHVLPIMRRQKAGCITHVGTTGAYMSLPLIAYRASKAALNEFTRWLAFENAPHNIRANVLMLGYIDTPMAIEGYHEATGTPRDELRAQRDALVPLGRMGSPWETAKVAAFLASDEASYITGAVLPMDGGLLTRAG